MKSSSISILKDNIRKKARQSRQALSDEQLCQADVQLVRQYEKHLAYKNNHKIAIYLQQDGELGTTELIKYLIEHECEIYLPKLFSDGSHQLNFCRYYQDSEMDYNRYNIAEPKVNDFIAIDELDMVFLPLTAFDSRGNRLGMGGGYYDRTLSKFCDKKLSLVGLAYDFQEVESCPVETFDQSLTMVLTPTRLIEF